MGGAYDRLAVIPQPHERISRPGKGACLWLVLAVGCAGSTASGAGASDEGQGQRASAKALNQLQARFEEQEQRLQELEGRMSLLEAEARQIRDALSSGRRRPKEVVRIGGEREPDEESTSASSERERDSGRRPTLRLRGKPQRSRARRQEPFEPPKPPPGVPDRLPVSVSAKKASRAELSDTSGESARSDGDAAVGEYRKALRLVQRGQFDAALEALAAFVVRHPDHHLADDATYWRGEAYYAKRDYEPALRQFEGVVASAPDGEKVRRALYKIALCHRRLGQEDDADEALRRLRRRFPESDAAGAAAREDAS